MSLVLFRVDDRLIHGQVVVGWGQSLHCGRIVLVNADVAGSIWEQELYRLAVPAQVDVIFTDAAGAAAGLAGWQADACPTVVLTADIETMAELRRAAPAVVRRINLGGIHHREGRRQRLPYLFLSDAEWALLSALATEGADVQAQDLPSSAPVALSHLGGAT